MPSSDQAKTQPDVKPQVPSEDPGKEPSQACAAATAGLEDALQRIAGQIGDADRRHCDALADMQERLGQFRRQVEQVRAGLPEQHAGALTRLQQEIAGLSERIAAFGRQRQSQKVTSGTAQAEASAAADEPWDAQSAEALTRVYEMAQAEDSAGRQPRRRPTLGKPGRPMQAAPSPHAPAPAYDQAWLEARFAGIAALLQQSLADSNPAKSLAALDRRFDRLEGRFDTLLNDVSVRFGGEWLELIEEHIKELAAHFEATSRQLGRLDAVDEQLRQLARALEDQQQWSRAQPAPLRDDAIAALIDTAAERAASRLAAAMPVAMPAPEAGGGTRIDALEGLMQDYIAERRRGERRLHAVDESVGRSTGEGAVADVPWNGPECGDCRVSCSGRDVADACARVSADRAGGSRLRPAAAGRPRCRRG
jgi:hypothetical protein